MLGTHIGIESKIPAFRELTFQTDKQIKKMFMRRKRKFYRTLVV